jgi:dihydrofolate reductase
VLALSPLVAGDFAAEFTTPGSQSEQATSLISERFAGQTGDTVTVAWRRRGGVEGAPDAMAAFFAAAERLEGIGDARPPRISRDGTIAVADLALTQRGTDVPADTGKRRSPSDPRVAVVRGGLTDVVAELRAREGRDIWLAGGGRRAGAMLRAGLVDELVLRVNPVTLGDGIPMFAGPALATRFELVRSTALPAGVQLVELRRAPA